MGSLRYFPFGNQFDLRMGTSFLKPEDQLIETDDHYLHEITLKRHILDSDHRYYYRSSPETMAAQWDIVALILDDLVKSRPGDFKLEKDNITWHWENKLTHETFDFEFGDPSTLPYEPLDWVGRQVQEDLIILSNDSSATLVAGQLCFANGFSLDDKFNQPFLAIHAPAPRMVGPTMNAAHKLLEHLPPMRPIWRASWNFKINDELDLTSRHNLRYKKEMDAVSPTLTAENIGDKLFIRIERQTLTRLPVSNCILFGIHTYINLLGEECCDGDRASRMLDVLRTTPREMMDYKAISPFETALLDYLALKARNKVAS
ncbi:MAG TPA: DUF3445 domain-containing protein [Cyclobacteriaceae bacterium]|nr:DUF3445 domain-containing protein [Cyclobacteriaceae bacterium]